MLLLFFLAGFALGVVVTYRVSMHHLQKLVADPSQLFAMLPPEVQAALNNHG